MSGVPGAQPTVVAVDVGGTTIKAARVDSDGRTHAEVTLGTGQGDAALERVLDVCRQLCDESTTAIAIAVPGIVDGERGVVEMSINLQWTAVPLASMILAATGVRTAIVHDVRAACTAETELGAGRGIDDLLMVVIGTGLSAAIVTGGRRLSGASNSAGEIGHMVVRPGGELCVCGQRGCVEVYSSAGGIARRYSAMGGDGSLGVARIASSSDPKARRVWDDATSLLGHALAKVVATIDPQVVVLAGGLSRAGDALLTPVSAALAEELPWRQAPPVRLSVLTSRAGLVGASIEAWRLSGRADVVRSWQPGVAVTAL